MDCSTWLLISLGDLHGLVYCHDQTVACWHKVFPLVQEFWSEVFHSELMKFCWTKFPIPYGSAFEDPLGLWELSVVTLLSLTKHSTPLMNQGTLRTPGFQTTFGKVFVKLGPPSKSVSSSSRDYFVVTDKIKDIWTLFKTVRFQSSSDCCYHAWNCLEGQVHQP